MCLMVPLQVLSADGSRCEVELGGRVERVSMLLEPEVVAGDWVLVLDGEVVRRLDPEQANEIRRTIELLDDEPSAVAIGT